MTEKKKKYLSPEIKVVEMSSGDIICTSQFPSTQNEAWEEAETNSWYNL